MVLLFAGLLTLLVGCAHEAPAPPRGERPPRTVEPLFDGTPVLPQADMSGTGPGSLVEAKPLRSTLGFEQENASAVRVVYRSTSGFDDRPTEVSGIVVVPPGEPPLGGWPILAVGHVLTGVIPQCAPSLADELGGYASILSVFVTNGYAVVMTDYEGLGTDGNQHMPLQSATLGNNIIDSVRAARHVLPTASTKWAAYGIGEGGLAAWAAADRASTYGSGMDMVGAVALSPFANMSGMADAAAQGVLPREQYYLYLLVLQSLADSPVGLNLAEYTSPRVKDILDVTATCPPVDIGGQTSAVAALQPDDLRPRDEAATARLRQLIDASAVPLVTTGPAAPVLVVYATEDQSVSATSIADAARTACERGNPVEIDRRIGDVNTSNELVTQKAIGWLQQRFDGQALANACVGVP